VPLVTSEEQARSLPEGSLVAIEGVPLPAAPLGDSACTSLLCSKDDPCCNECHYLGDGHEILVPQPNTRPFRVFLPIGSCRIERCAADCTPFGRTPKTKYRFVGKLVTPPWYFPKWMWLMEVSRFCRADSNQPAGPPASATVSAAEPSADPWSEVFGWSGLAKRGPGSGAGSPG
jgi:hypothetical protein